MGRARAGVRAQLRGAPLAAGRGRDAVRDPRGGAVRGAGGRPPARAGGARRTGRGAAGARGDAGAARADQPALPVQHLALAAGAGERGRRAGRGGDRAVRRAAAPHLRRPPQRGRRRAAGRGDPARARLPVDRAAPPGRPPARHAGGGRRRPALRRSLVRAAAAGGERGEARGVHARGAHLHPRPRGAGGRPAAALGGGRRAGAVPEQVERAPGAGLRLVRGRVEARYGDGAQVRITTAPGAGFVVALGLPAGAPALVASGRG